MLANEDYICDSIEIPFLAVVKLVDMLNPVVRYFGNDLSVMWGGRGRGLRSTKTSKTHSGL